MMVLYYDALSGICVCVCVCVRVRVRVRVCVRVCVLGSAFKSQSPQICSLMACLSPFTVGHFG